MTGFRFAERMAGGLSSGGRFAFDIEARSPTPMSPWGTTLADAVGTVTAEGLAQDARVTGRLVLSPLRGRRMRYVLDFTGDDGRSYRFDGNKEIRPWSLASWTTLRGVIADTEGVVWSRANARFDFRGDMLGLLGSVRAWRPASAADAGGLLAPRWRGQPGRLEVWYATFTDPVSGEGFWLHHELLAPVHGAPRRQGWAVAFPAGGAPVLGRFAGDAAAGPGTGLPVFSADGAGVRDGSLEGDAGALSWSLRYRDDGRPLYTFPRTAWERQLFPAAQVVPAPSARFSGELTVAGRGITLHEAPGAVARIYGRGNAERWGWAHADLPGGDTLEIVAAVSRLHGLRQLRPLTFLQLRQGGRDWPRWPLRAAARLRTELREDGFTTCGTVGDRRLQVDVTLDPGESVTLDYDDPEGPGPRCTNSERATLELTVERRAAGGRWRLERHERLARTAHAEVGQRP